MTNPARSSDFSSSPICTVHARRRLLLTTATLAGLALAGCKSAPAPAVKPARFSAAQIAALRELGFAESEEGWTLNLGGKVLFAFGDDRLGSAEGDTIGHITDVLRKVELTHLRIEGHTDNVGNADFNQRLSLRRAEVVAREFQVRGMPASNMQTRGFGMTHPIADNATDAGRSQNRRVAVVVLGE